MSCPVALWMEVFWTFNLSLELTKMYILSFSRLLLNSQGRTVIQRECEYFEVKAFVKPFWDVWWIHFPCYKNLQVTDYFQNETLGSVTRVFYDIFGIINFVNEIVLQDPHPPLPLPPPPIPHGINNMKSFFNDHMYHISLNSFLLYFVFKP